MLQLFGILSGLLNAVGYIPYVRDVLKKKTHPARASWLIWTILGAIAFFSQLAKGADNSLWMTGIQTLGVGFVFILSLKYGKGGLQKKDYGALALAAIGLFIWYYTKDATAALLISIGVNSIGALLTIVKGYQDPTSETLSTWILGSSSGLAAMLAVGSFDIILLSYPCYIFLSNLLITVAILLGRHAKKKH